MVFIISDELDTATNRVLYWLKHFRKSFIRLNDTNALNNCLVELKDNSFSFKFNDKNIHSKFITSFWYRRGKINLSIQKPVHIDIQNNLIEEVNGITNYLYQILETKNRINKISDTKINKLNVLQLAIKIGLEVPDTKIISTKDELKNFFLNHNEKIISKAIWNGFEFKINNIIYSFPTILFDYHKVEDLIPNNFFPTLFQAYTEKKFELRIFYLKGDFFASAIFSQNDEQTKIDFRNYNNNKPNRVTPFKLPPRIEHDLNKLMETLELNSGSIDMIYTPEGKFVFLEVNPVGQFAQISQPCNYLLPKKIAELLSNIP